MEKASHTKLYTEVSGRTVSIGQVFTVETYECSKNMTLNNHLIPNNNTELTSFVEPFPRLYFLSCKAYPVHSHIFQMMCLGMQKERVYTVITLLR